MRAPQAEAEGGPPRTRVPLGGRGRKGGTSGLRARALGLQLWAPPSVPRCLPNLPMEIRGLKVRVLRRV